VDLLVVVGDVGPRLIDGSGRGADILASELALGQSGARGPFGRLCLPHRLARRVDLLPADLPLRSIRLRVLQRLLGLGDLLLRHPDLL
jgi:hypothetical protein